MKQLFNNEKVFSNPKPVSLLANLLSFVISRDDLVLDFFAGSGTTAHAVAELNAEDGGNRRFILVSSTEATEEQPDRNLCRAVCAERVRRVLGGYVNPNGEPVKGLGGNFAYLRARRIPTHRLSLQLHHDEIWSALQLLHGRPLTPWTRAGFAHSGDMAYLADFQEGALTRLDRWQSRSDSGGMLYSWAPERLRDAASGVDLRPIPQYLRERFGR